MSDDPSKGCVRGFYTTGLGQQPIGLEQQRCLYGSHKVCYLVEAGTRV